MYVLWKIFQQYNCSCSIFIEQCVSDLSCLKRSNFWLITKKENGTAKCNTCTRDILCRGGSTSNMATHLLQHGVNLKECTVFNTVCCGLKTISQIQLMLTIATSHARVQSTDEQTFAFYKS